MFISVFFIVSYAFMVAFAAAFLLLLCYKWGVVEWLQVHGSDKVSKMAHCDFCMSWWLCVILSAFLIGASGDAMLLIVPVLATPLTRRLI